MSDPGSVWGTQTISGVTGITIALDPPLDNLKKSGVRYSDRLNNKKAVQIMAKLKQIC